MTEKRGGWEVRNYEVADVTVVKDAFCEDGWVAVTTPPYTLHEGTTLFFNRQEALKAAMDQAHYERKRLKHVEEKLLAQYLGETDDTTGMGQTGTEG